MKAARKQAAIWKQAIIALVAAGGLIWAGVAQAQSQIPAMAGNKTPPGTQVYAVMSLIGDALSIVEYSGMANSRIDHNTHRQIPIAENALDVSALNAIAEVVRRQDPAAAQEMLQTRNPMLRRLQEHIFDDSAEAKAARESLKDLLAQYNASKFILVTKHRTEGEIPLGTTTLPAGTLEGLGFYVDSSIALTNMSTLQSGQGMMAGFVYATVWLVDAKTMAVLKQLPVTRARAMIRNGSSDRDVTTWDKLSDVQKVRFLQTMIRDGMSDTLPRLMSPS